MMVISSERARERDGESWSAREAGLWPSAVQQSARRRWQAGRQTYSLAELLDQGNVLSAHTALAEPSAHAGLNELDELLVAEIEQVLEVDASVRELAEGPLFLVSGLREAEGKAEEGRRGRCSGEYMRVYTTAAGSNQGITQSCGA